MNVQDFTYLLQNPDKVVNPVQTNQLEDVLEEYPYFQAARALHLKGLKNLNSFKYNNALKVTAAYCADRDILFNFITSENFLRTSATEHIELRDFEVHAEEIKAPIKKEVPLIEDSEDKPLPQDNKDAEHILDPGLFKSKEQNIDKKTDSDVKIVSGSPLPFDKKEKFSFSEWLNLTSATPIKRNSNKETKKIEDSAKKKKFDRIDKFISENPKIIPKADLTEKIDISSSSKINKNELMTETLAKVYLEQKKYKKAIQSYKILSLKYPEKSGFFADQIKAIEKIQQDNT